MFGKAKKDRPKRDHSGKNLAQYGLFDMPSEDMDEDVGGSNDSDLEAELAALSSGGAKPKRPPRKKPIPQSNLDAMIAASLKDLPSEEELSGDDDDPDLLNELAGLTGGEDVGGEEPQAEPALADTNSDSLGMLETRLKMYEEAETAAKEANEGNKARRYVRAQKTLKDLIRQAKSGKPIDMSEVPPEVHYVKKSAPPPPAEVTNEDAPMPDVTPQGPAPAVDVTPEESTPVEEVPERPITKEINTELLTLLAERMKQYKVAALTAKKSGDNETAINYVRVARQFETVIEAVKAGQPVDLSKMPGPPGEEATSPPPAEKIEHNAMQGHAEAEAEADAPAPSLISAGSILEALEQRMDVYKEQENKAKQEENNSKARRYGRIVKQFQDAIKLHKAGKPVPFDELPTPPGYAPIPVDGPPKPRPPPPVPSPAQPKPAQPSPPAPQVPVRQSTSTSHAEKQVLILLAKQKQFKEAALNAKKKGELVQAKEYLRQSKGFDNLIEAARGGFPVDWSSIPVSPDAKTQLDEDYETIMADDCTEDDSSNKDIITRLESQLTKQLKMCLTTRDHFKALGDVAGTNRFERLALNVTKDLDFVRLVQRSPDTKVPKFHYEMKDFSIVKSFTELGDNDLELVIMRGINYATKDPKDIDTYVKFSFPYPQETPFAECTSTVKDTNNPEYNETFVIPIQRNQRSCQRVFKRHGIKFEVYSKAGWFRSDSLLGTVTVKLQHLETQCELHESFDLLEGRRKAVGKLEVRLRLRHPIVTQQVEQLHEKWLVIDQ